MKEKTTNYEEKELRAPSGWAVLFLTIILYLGRSVCLYSAQ